MSSSIIEENGGLRAIAVLIDELKHDDLALRVNSFSKLNVISGVLGEVRTRNELIPFIHVFINNDDDEVLVVLAKQLGMLLKNIGGPSFADILLKPLELLCRSSDINVQESSVEAIISISNELKPDLISKWVYPLLERLLTNDSMYCRICSALLFPSVYGIVSEIEKSVLLEYIYSVTLLTNRHLIDLSSDSMPLVRKYTLLQLEKLARLVSKDVADKFLFPTFCKFSKDDQDSIRLFSPYSAVELAKVLDKELVNLHLVPIIVSFTTDSCWRVRYTVSEQFDKILAALDSKIVNTTFNSCFIGLLLDSESEVRLCCASKISPVCQYFDQSFVLNQIIPVVVQLASDPSVDVRKILAGNLMGLCEVLDKEYVITFLVPLFLNLLNDASSEVRLEIIASIGNIGQVIGQDQLSKCLMPPIIELALDNKWRVRLAIIELIPGISERLGPSLFELRLNDLFMTWLGDEIFSIREAAVKKLTILSLHFGKEWALKHAIPCIQGQMTNLHYLHRLTCLFAANDMVHSFNDKDISCALLPIVISLSHDPVPNVRFNCAKVLSSMRKTLSNHESLNDVLECLKKTLQR